MKKGGALLFLFLCLEAAGQEFAAVNDDNRPFPVYRLINTAMRGEILREPTWPLYFPPDAFPPGKSCTVTIEQSVTPPALDCLSPDERPSSDESQDGLTLRLSYDAAGALREFPFYFEGIFYQAEAEWDETGKLKLLNLSGTEGGLAGAETASLTLPLSIEICPWDDDFPEEAKVLHNLVCFSLRNNYLTETWFDGEGNRLGAFSVVLSEGGYRAALEEEAFGGLRQPVRYYYDSWGNVSAISAEGAEYSALYSGPGRLRYIEIRALSGEKRVYSFQWDEQGLLTALRGPFDDGAEEIRYRYDSTGNWTVRREIRAVGDLMLPDGGLVITRAIEE